MAQPARHLHEGLLHLDHEARQRARGRRVGEHLLDELALGLVPDVELAVAGLAEVGDPLLGVPDAEGEGGEAADELPLLEEVVDLVGQVGQVDGLGHGLLPLVEVVDDHGRDLDHDEGGGHALARDVALDEVVVAGVDRLEVPVVARDALRALVVAEDLEVLLVAPARAELDLRPGGGVEGNEHLLDALADDELLGVLRGLHEAGGHLVDRVGEGEELVVGLHLDPGVLEALLVLGVADARDLGD